MLENKSNDKIWEVENILEFNDDGKNKKYFVKWVGHKKPSWINESDFIERDLLIDFHKYDLVRMDQNIIRKAYIYCRTSKKNIHNEVSLQDQEAYCLNYASRNNINICGIFKDNGVSAKNMENQFSLNFIFNIINSGECILFYDVSRFSRSLIQAIEKLEYLRLNIGAVAHSVHDGITWNNIASNRAIFTHNLSHSQLHSEVISEKVNSSIEFRRNRGDYIGTVSYGYKTEIIEGIRKRVINDLEIQVIRDIFNEANKIYMKKINTKYTNINKIVSNINNKDCRLIAININNLYKNRNNKEFTSRFIKNILLKWKVNVKIMRNRNIDIKI